MYLCKLNFPNLFIAFGVALKSFYQPDAIVVPAEQAAGVLAAAHFLNFENLRVKAVEKLSQSLTLRNLSTYYLCANKVNFEIIH